MAAAQTSPLVKKKFFTELPKLKVLTRPDETRSEVTVYVKGTKQLIKRKKKKFFCSCQFQTKKLSFISKNKIKKI